MPDDPWAVVKTEPIAAAPVGADPWAVVKTEPLPTQAHEGMSHTPPPSMSSQAQRFIGGVESGALEANKLAAQFGLWLGHPHDTEDLAEAVRLQNEHEEKVRAMAPPGRTDWPHIAGEAVNPLNFIAGPESAVRGASVIPRVLRGVFSGARGALTAPSEGTDNLGQKLKQVERGAVAGGLTSGAIPNMSDDARLLVNEGVRLTPGQRGGFAFRKPEEAATSVPITDLFIAHAEHVARQDFNRAFYNRVLAPIGEKYGPNQPIGHEGVDELRRRLGAAYDRALEGTTFIANPAGMTPYGLSQAHLNELNDILSLMTTENRQQFNSIVNRFYTQRVPANRLMDGETFKRVESELGEKARSFLKTENMDDQSVGEALEEVRFLLREAHAVQNPRKAAELQAVNKAYSRYAVVERGARQRAGSDGLMTPQDALSALSAMDSSVRKNRFARGVLDMQDLARAGNKVLSSRLRNSGTADRLLWSDAAKLLLGTSAGHAAGLSEQQIAGALAGLTVAGLPYIRLPAGLPTANIGSRIAAGVDRGLQAAAPATGNLAAQTAGPQVGIIEDGWRYKGGNPADQQSWERVQ